MNRVGKALLGVVAVAAVAAAAPIPRFAGAAGQQGWWSTEGYSVTNSGYNPNEPTLTAARVPYLKLQLTISPGQAAPVVDKGRVFVYRADAVTAYDEVTGEQLWRHELESGSRPDLDGRMALVDGKLVVAWNNGSPPVGGDYLEVFDAPTGKVLVAPKFTAGSVSTLLVDKGVIVISGESRYYADTVAYRLSDGTQLWTSEFYLDQPASADGRILVEGYGPRDTGRFSKILDIRTGEELFSFRYAAYKALAASADGTKFYLTWGHSLQMLDVATGKLTWIASYVYPEFAALTPSRLYVSTTDNKMFAVNLSDNSIAWTKPFGARLLRPIVSGGVLYVTAFNSQLYALNPVDASLLTTPAFTAPVYPPVVTGARVYLTDGAKLSVYGI